MNYPAHRWSGKQKNNLDPALSLVWLQQCCCCMRAARKERDIVGLGEYISAWSIFTTPLKLRNKSKSAGEK
jgi:hypothetical protein